MSTPIILAIDEGTTNAKAIAVDRAGRVLAKARYHYNWSILSPVGQNRIRWRFGWRFLRRLRGA